jgi:hypothetical protein
LPKIKKKQQFIESFEQLDLNNSKLLKKIGDTKYKFSRYQNFSELQSNEQTASRTQLPKIVPDFKSPQMSKLTMSRDISCSSDSGSGPSGRKILLRDQSFAIGASHSNSKFFPPIKNYAGSKELRRDHSLN